MPGGSKPSGGSSKPGVGGYDWSLGLPVTKETDTTYGGSKPGKAPTQKLPNPPDPYKLIELQGRENRLNEIGPSGSTINFRDPNTGVWTSQRSFSPELQNLYNQQVKMAGEDPNAYNERVAQSVFNRQKSLLDPVYDQQERSMIQRLVGLSAPRNCRRT